MCFCCLLPSMCYCGLHSCYVSVKAASMSISLENKHKQSRENIEKTKNTLKTHKKRKNINHNKQQKHLETTKKNTKTKNIKKTNKTNSQRLLAGPPPFLKTSPECFFVVFFWRFVGCYWFSQGFCFLVFLFRSICVLTISFNLQVCEPKSHLKTYVLCPYNESV